MKMVIAAIALFAVCLLTGIKPSQAQTIRYEDYSQWYSNVSGTSSGPTDPYAVSVKSSPQMAVPHASKIVRIWFRAWKSGQNSTRVNSARVYFRVRVNHQLAGLSPNFSSWYEVNTTYGWWYIDVYAGPQDSFTLQTYTTNANYSFTPSSEWVYTNCDAFQVCWN